MWHILRYMPRYKKNQEYKGFKLRVGPQGRIVIPAPIRKALNLKPGSVIHGRIENGRVILSLNNMKGEASFEQTEKRLWEKFKDAKFSTATLRATRRREADKEAGRT